MLCKITDVTDIHHILGLDTTVISIALNVSYLAGDCEFESP